MTDPAPPTCVTKRDGRMVPFEADRISRSLFAAAEGLGRPDAFLARELADGVVHFLAAEHEGQIPTTQHIAEGVVKVLRQFGQPALADAFAAHQGKASLSEAHLAARRAQTLSSIYTRDLTAAQESGLLTLTDLDAPDELAGRVCDPSALAAAGPFVAVDGLDHFASQTRQSPAHLARYLKGVRAVVNLNTGEPPSWAGALVEGPLFAAAPMRPDPSTADGLLDPLPAAAPQTRIDWHLGEADFAPERLGRLVRVVGKSRRAAICFVFDRPRRPVALAEGLDRRHPAALVRVDLHLPALARQGGLLADADRFCQRLGPLARLALSAAIQKREHLRRRAPDLSRGFLLDRARLVVVPVGLDEVVRLYTDWGLANGGPSLELGRRIVTRLRDVLRADGRAAQLEACLDGPASFDVPGRAFVPGLTPWDEVASIRAQLRAAGTLHALAEQGTLALRPPAGEPADDEALAGWLQEAWRRTEVVRLRLVMG